MWYPVVTEVAMLCLTILMAWEQILAVRIAFRTSLGNRSQGLLAPGMNTNLHRWAQYNMWPRRWTTFLSALGGGSSRTVGALCY